MGSLTQSQYSILFFMSGGKPLRGGDGWGGGGHDTWRQAFDMSTNLTWCCEPDLIAFFHDVFNYSSKLSQPVWLSKDEAV